jgi:prevent-host-death family protein
MHSPNVHQVRENLAEYLAAAERGEEVLICRRNQPVARLVAIARVPARKPRPIGRAPDAGESLPAAFFDSLPADMLAALCAGTEPDAALEGLAAKKPAGRRARSSR